MGAVDRRLAGMADVQAVEGSQKEPRGEEEGPVEEVKDLGVREELVRTAVKFLENNKVQSSTEKMKREFLTKKGLTEAEIEIAFSKVRQVVPMKQVQEKMQVQRQPIQSQLPLVGPDTTLSTKLRDILNILLLIGGVSYSARYLWKRYISPWLFGPAKPVKTPHEMVLETTQAVLRTVEQLQKSVESLQTSLDNHSSKLEQMSQKQVKPEETGSMQELKSEIQSVKGLLLSSRSFPQTPPISPPTIPAWQLDTEETEVGPDLVADTMETAGEQEGKESQSVNGSSGSNSSEIEMINPDSNENSSEDGQ